jgi:hypothetical protein
MIAITVSTNYSDLLPFILNANSEFFKKWIFVTSPNDQATIDILSKNPNVIILFWDFQNSGYKFDKGGAVKLAQEYTYEHFPDEWYLLLDSDICLPFYFAFLINNLNELGSVDQEAVYGCAVRREYSKSSDYKKSVNYKETREPWVIGFFQLYRKKVFYSPSNDASQCDLDFLKHFSKHFFINDFVCNHLGSPYTNWQGREINSDFIIDEPI